GIDRGAVQLGCLVGPHLGGRRGLLLRGRDRCGQAEREGDQQGLRWSHVDVLFLHAWMKCACSSNKRATRPVLAATVSLLNRGRQTAAYPAARSLDAVGDAANS